MICKTCNSLILGNSSMGMQMYVVDACCVSEMEDDSLGYREREEGSCRAFIGKAESGKVILGLGYLRLDF